MSKPASRWFPSNSKKAKELIKEVQMKGYKISPDDVVGILKDRNGRIIWLEQGHLGKNPSGLAHILNEHGGEFESQGIPKGYVSYFVLNAVAEGNMIGYQGKGSHPREVYEYHYGGKKYLVAVTVGSNGYIVGANLTDESKIWRK